MSVGGHVVVDVYEFGGIRVVVGNHVEMRVGFEGMIGMLSIQ